MKTEISNAHHTPGPWILIADETTEQGRFWRINGMHECAGFNGPQDCFLATVYSVEANAKLCASAPELLAALESLLNECDGEAFASTGTATAEILFQHAAKARAAISKARGGAA